MQKTGMEIISSEVKAYKSDRSVFHAVLCPGHASQILPSSVTAQALKRRPVFAYLACRESRTVALTDPLCSYASVACKGRGKSTSVLDLPDT